jgi:hypothetical protein
MKLPPRMPLIVSSGTDLWDAYLAQLSDREIHGPVLPMRREVLTATIAAMGDAWLRRFLATRGLIARTPVLRDHSDLASLGLMTRRRPGWATSRPPRPTPPRIPVTRPFSTRTDRRASVHGGYVAARAGSFPGGLGGR